MPRAEQSGATKILEYFEKAPLETANLVFDLARDRMRSRNQKSADAKAKALATAAPAEKTKTRKRKKSKANGAAGHATAAPAATPETADPNAGEQA